MIRSGDFMIKPKNTIVVIICGLCLLFTIIALVFIKFKPNERKQSEDTDFVKQEETEPINLESNKQNKQVSVMLNDKLFAQEACIDNNCIMLPIASFLQEIGAKIDWISNDCAKITFLNKSFSLSLSQPSFFNCTTGQEWLIPAPGSSNFNCFSIDKDIMVDSDTLRIIFTYNFKIQIDVTYNNEDNIVMVSTTNTGDASMCSN